MVEPTSPVQSGWNQPTKYERWYASSLGRIYAASLERVLRPWLSNMAGSLGLDIGCGPGLAIERLCSSDLEIIGMDCSLEMAQRALARSQKMGRSDQFVVGSVEKIPFADETFDVALCVNCLEFVESRSMAFAEIARILRPSGHAVVGVLNQRSVWELTRRIRRPFSKHSYYRGKFFSKDSLRACCTEVELVVDEMKSAVHFPPIPPGPLSSIYDRFDRSSQKRLRRGGAVILCHATKPDPGYAKT